MVRVRTSFAGVGNAAHPRVQKGIENVDPKPRVTEDTLKSFLDAFNHHDIVEIMSFFGNDPVFEMPRGQHPWGTRAEGRAAVRALLATRLEGIPDVHYSEDRHFVCGDRGVSEWLLTGTTRTGKKIRVRGCDLFEFADGKITKKDSFWKIVE
jgi:ketosteroid isomerase-like protein